MLTANENTYTINVQTRLHTASPQVTRFSLLAQSLEVEKNKKSRPTMTRHPISVKSLPASDTADGCASRRSLREGGGKFHPALWAPPEGAVTPDTSASGPATFSAGQQRRRSEGGDVSMMMEAGCKNVSVEWLSRIER